MNFNIHKVLNTTKQPFAFCTRSMEDYKTFKKMSQRAVVICVHGKHFRWMVHRMIVVPLSASFVDSVPDFRRLSRWNPAEFLSQKENIILRLCCHGNMECLDPVGDQVAETRRLSRRNHRWIVFRYFGKRMSVNGEPVTESVFRVSEYNHYSSNLSNHYSDQSEHQERALYE